MVVWGQVKLAFSSPQGSEKVVEILGPLQSFGEAIMFLDRPCPVFAEALADTLLLHIGASAVLDQLSQDPNFARKLLAGMAIRLHSMIRDVESISSIPACSGSSAICCRRSTAPPAPRRPSRP